MNRNMEGSHNLIIAILNQAIVDALDFKPKKTVGAQNQQDCDSKASALAFLNPKNELFCRYCELVDYNPEYVYEKFLKHYLQEEKKYKVSLEVAA